MITGSLPAKPSCANATATASAIPGTSPAGYSKPSQRRVSPFAVTASRSTRRGWGKSSSMPYGNPYVSPAHDTTVVVGAGEGRVQGGITALLGSAGSGGVIGLSPLLPQAAIPRQQPKGATTRLLR